MTYKIYPHYDSIVVNKGEEGLHISLSTRVRLERKGVRYLVYVETNEVFKEDHAPTLFVAYHNMITRFLDCCLRTKHLWMVPPEKMIKDLIQNKLLELDPHDLTDKEYELLRTHI